jgi:citrate synthase
VKRATLYAYVSRGQLRSRRRPGQQESLFDRAQIDELARSGRPSSGPAPLLRFRTLSTAVSSQLDGDLLYRGRPVGEVAAQLTFEEAVALVLGASEVGTLAPPVAQPGPAGGAGRGRRSMRSAPGLLPRLRAVVPELPPERRLPVTVQLLAGTDPLAVDLRPDHVRRTAVMAVHACLQAVVPEAAAPDGGAGEEAVAQVPALLLTGLRGSRPPRADVELLRVLLTALLDHGLTASTIAARVAASTRAGIHDCLAAGYAAMAGPLHGSAPVAARALLDDSRSAVEVVGASLRRDGHVPGFGHFLYEQGDPRAEIVLDALWERRGTARLRQRLSEVARVVQDHSGLLPNIDLASAAVLAALRLPASAGEVVFQVARSYGLTAHVIEEYAEEPLRWRGRDPIT